MGYHRNMTTTTTVWGPRQGRTGPTHLATEGWGYQAWCGARAQFRHHVRPGTPEDVTCPACLAALKAGRPRSRRSTR